jgi:LuxR family transcriptional regulator, regulator of acetate metabolism
VTTAGRASEPALRRLLDDLHQLERESVELEYVRRSDALDRVRDAVRALGELGSPAGILDRAAQELAQAAGFDRVLISEVVQRTLRPRAIWSEGPVELALAPIPLEYPLIEEELLRRQRAALVTVATAGSRTPAALAAAFRWDSYVVATLSVDGRPVGLLHADAHRSGRALDELDREVAIGFCEGLAGVFERAVLRDTLARHRRELQAAVRWMSGRLAPLSDDVPALPSADANAALIESLTPRELEVLRLLAHGRTNRGIADALLVREGTIKYHVKNILRKLGATSRADAVARYVRATGARR